MRKIEILSRSTRHAKKSAPAHGAQRRLGAQRHCPPRARAPQPGVQRSALYRARGHPGRLSPPRQRDRIEVWDAAPESRMINARRSSANSIGRRRQNQQTGLGLGLAIVDRLCRLLDHPLELGSTPGEGSQFAITVPRAPAQREPAATPHPLLTAIQPFTGKFIVVIDNDRLVLDGVSGLLRGWGCDVSASTSSSTALASLLELHRKPDLIISDHHFSHGETGIAVIERLRHTFAAPFQLFSSPATFRSSASRRPRRAATSCCRSRSRR